MSTWAEGRPEACSTAAARVGRTERALVAAARSVCALAWLFAVDSVPALAADSLSFRVEVGTATEVSNEQFFESSIDDTTILGRRLHSTPETRVAAVALAELSRNSVGNRWQVRLAPEVSIGDKAVRLGASGSIRGRPTDLVRVSLEPRAEFQRDESFGFHRRDWRASIVGRVRRLSLDELGAVRVSAGSEVVRTIAGSDPFALSVTSARAGVGCGRTPLFGPEWDVEYGAIARVFRDSTFRDHVEQRLGISLREDFEGGHALSLTAEAERRVSLRDARDSRDRFTQLHTQTEAGFELGACLALRPELRAEIIRYDDPDSVVEFDYELYGARLALRREFGSAWRFGTGPRGEWLAASWCPSEAYRELAWSFELERLTASAWWNLAPAVGRRSYATPSWTPAAGDAFATALHSGFDFVELAGFLDQQFPAGLRIRALATLRAERHADRDQDARSLYFSFDVRRLF